MIQSALIALKLSSLQLGLAQIPVTSEVLTPEQASLVFSGPKFLVALLAGILMAFAFQLLLTNFSLAVGISALGGSSSSDESESLGGTVRKVETAAGLWALVTATIALFSACFLAVKLSLIESTLLGAIIGVVIWSAFFTVIVWLGSSAVGSLIGSVASTVTSGMQGIMGTASAALGANVAKNQMVSTAEEITAAVRRELTSGFDPDSIKNTLQSSLSGVQLPQLDTKQIRSQFEKLLKEGDLQSIADNDLLKNVNRQTFVDLISSRTDFSKSDINGIADQLQGAWNQVVKGQNPTDQVINLLQQASPEELQSEQLAERIQQLATVGGGNGKQSNGIVKQAIEIGLGAALPAVLKRVDFAEIDVDKVTHQLQQLSGKVQEIDVDKITQQLQQLKDQATQQASKVGSSVAHNLPALPNNTIKADIEEYILNSFPWHFNSITIKDEFKEVIYDPNANPGTIRRQLEEINLEYFTNLLKQRGDISEAKVKDISEQMESIRTEVLETVKQASATEKSQSLRTRLEDYLRSTGKEELNPEGIERDLTKLLEDPEAGIEDLSQRFSEIDRDTLVKLLASREDINEEEANNIVGQFERTRDNVLNRAQELQEQARAKADELRQRVEEYLRNTNKEELNPEGIKRDFGTLLEDPQAGLSALRGRLSQFDRDTLVKLLSQRQDLSEEQVNQTIDQLLTVRDNVLQAPQKVAETAKQQYEKTTIAISEYLRNTNLEELNPEGIQQDLQKLLADPKEGADALRERLSQVDRETLVKLLTQRGDLSEEQVNRTIDSTQQAINNIVKAPQRLAKRATQRAQEFEANLENYLRNTNKEELNPDSIKRDLQLLLSSPRAGASSLGERVSKFDRSTLVALLSQREDISEEEANRIVDQIDSVRNSIVEQYQQIQQRVQSALDSVFGSIRNYLNSLERPELNYEGIQQDFAKLFDDPQTGFEALRDRLSSFDRDTLVAVLSSREDISEAQANKIIDQIEGARDTVLRRAERIQKETQKRLNAIKEQVQKQGVETKKAVAGAAWWLFNTAFVSLAASALAGALAVSGFDLFG
ncbi:MFS transporter [Komarekiella sp. 'clone 1']|uniref:MFS transporter n=1 Tax=Komarekiella delphini-convector SJRDD-AB1 TaxID=2593771 RepID=A0AA40T1T1_9NOST|nr:MFS transporter [Komarekiella delphini-convector]MBD6619343.1 MFS transporter [Komarekiella delphini-convector SJRDD-AB1]